MYLIPTFLLVTLAAKQMLTEMQNADGTPKAWGRQVLEHGISTLEFHYLRSANILDGIGKGLAEALVARMKVTERFAVHTQTIQSTQKIRRTKAMKSQPKQTITLTETEL
jgi:curli biogenesis system outer membrane secretion channel CsgG